MEILKDFEGFLFGIGSLVLVCKASYHDVVEDALGGKGFDDLKGPCQTPLSKVPWLLIVDLFAIEIDLSLRG